jgi:hypothetical protein
VREVEKMHVIRLARVKHVAQRQRPDRALDAQRPIPLLDDLLVRTLQVARGD